MDETTTSRMLELADLAAGADPFQGAEYSKQLVELLDTIEDMTELPEKKENKVKLESLSDTNKSHSGFSFKLLELQLPATRDQILAELKDHKGFKLLMPVFKGDILLKPYDPKLLLRWVQFAVDLTGEQLTESERRVVDLLSEGKTHTEVAEILGISIEQLEVMKGKIGQKEMSFGD